MYVEYIDNDIFERNYKNNHYEDKLVSTLLTFSWRKQYYNKFVIKSGDICC